MCRVRTDQGLAWHPTSDLSIRSELYTCAAAHSIRGILIFSKNSLGRISTRYISGVQTSSCPEHLLSPSSTNLTTIIQPSKHHPLSPLASKTDQHVTNPTSRWARLGLRCRIRGCTNNPPTQNPKQRKIREWRYFHRSTPRPNPRMEPTAISPTAAKFTYHLGLRGRNPTSRPPQHRNWKNHLPQNEIWHGHGCPRYPHFPTQIRGIQGSSRWCGSSDWYALDFGDSWV